MGTLVTERFPRLRLDIPIMLLVLGLLLPCSFVINFVGATPTQIFQERTEEDSVTPKRWVLLIGVSTYENGEFGELPGAAADMEGLERALVQNGFPVEQMTVLTNRVGARDPRRLPTATNIRKQLKRLSAELKPNDTIWMALAGHGFQSNAGDYSFCPTDADLNDPTSLIGIQEIYAVLNHAPSGFKLLLVDACRESLSDRSTKAIGSQSFQNIPEPPTNTAVFFSCSPGQLAYERIDGKTTHGVFFHAVIRALHGEAARADGLLTLPDLERFVKKDVQSFVEKTYAADQHPTIRNNTVGLEPLFENLLIERKLQEVIRLWDRQKREMAYSQLREILGQSSAAPMVLAQYSRMLADDFEDTEEQKLLEQASDLAEQAVQLAPERAAPYLARANVRRIQGNFSAMLADCEIAVRVEPNDKRSYVFRALAHQLLGNSDLMRRDAEQASAIPQFDPLAESLIAGFFFLLEETDQGFRVLDDAILIAPDVPMLHFMKGYGLDQVGDHDQAILSYTAALRLDPNDDEILIRRAVSLARVGDRPAAISDVQAVERLKPSRDDLPAVRQFVQESSVLRQRRQTLRPATTKDQVPKAGSESSEPQSRPTPAQVIAKSPRD